DVRRDDLGGLLGPALTSAPALTSGRIARTWLRAAAHISAVWPRVESWPLASAPWSIRRRTASGLPARAAVITAVSPPGNAVLGSAPAFRSSSTMAGSAVTAAIDNGCAP